MKGSWFLFILMILNAALANASDYVSETPYTDQDLGYKRIQQWDNNYQDSVDEPTLGFSRKEPGYVRFRAYHHTMGTQILPLNWFAALETDKGASLASPEVYESFGFIKSDAPTQYNPYNLPIGFAVSIDEKAELKFGEKKWLGLNCAGCHTTKMKINGKDVIVDGNATMFRLNQFEFALADIIEKTLYDKNRFKRFADKVRPGVNYGFADNAKPWEEQSSLVKAVRRGKLREVLTQFSIDFQTFLTNNHIRENGTHVEFSPGSVDALTLGGNMAAGCNRAMWEDPENDPKNLLGKKIFKLPLLNKLYLSREQFYEEGNCQAADVPVNIPHIWSTNNFAGGHYAAEETNVTGRNFGAAMTGFGALRMTVRPKVTLALAKHPDIDMVSIDKDNVLHFETSIKLKDLDKNQKWYDTLKAPTWQGLVDAGVVDPMSDDEIHQAEKGKQLYNTKCSACHGVYNGPVGDENSGLEAVALTSPNRYGAQFWDLVRVPTGSTDDQGRTIPDEIGTDKARNNRDGIESNKTLPARLVEKFEELFGADIPEDRSVEARFYRQFIVLANLRSQVANEEEQRQAFNPYGLVGPALYNEGNIDGRPFQMLMGCRDIDELRRNLVIADAYKARPLDGIAFTAPYLHNGSVPTLWDLFAPSNEKNEHGAIRPAAFDVGCENYDIEKMGFVCDKESSDPLLSKYADAFDINRFGQSNMGHEGDLDPDKWGVGTSYGTDLSSEEKTQLIHFLKTLESIENPSRGVCELYTYPI